MNEDLPTIDGGGGDENRLKNLATLVYGCYALSWLLPFMSIIGIIVAHVRIKQAEGTWLESHFRWQIRTFWFSLLWAVLGGILLLVLVGYLVLVGVGIWNIYRVIKGFLNLSENKPMYT